jgi:nicotinamide mononucleotide (NMN) deamidase PncC
MPSSTPVFDELIPRDVGVIKELKRIATEKGYNLLKLINETGGWNGDDYEGLQIGTSESLTSGLIIATLVDIPWGGFMKYGGFAVYDTDAKRVFNNVSVDDVYTHSCAKEMAIGVLKNSNATLAISVTGNAMPLNQHVDMLGEVFIGIAGYNADNQIMYITRSVNMCDVRTLSDTALEDQFKEHCNQWYKKIADEGKYNPRDKTARISQEIRYYTASVAYDLCMEFIRNTHPQVPDFVIARKKQNAQHDETKAKVHKIIPANRFENGGPGICRNDILSLECIYKGYREEDGRNTSVFRPARGGNKKQLRKSSKRKNKKSARKTKRKGRK